MENKDLAGYSFYTADVSALFTNVNVDSCISDILDLAHTHWDEIVTHGLELIDLQELLDVGFRNAFFTFNGRLYWQVLGVFMGYCPSPTAAIIRLAKCEMNSIYIDPNYISSPVLSTYLRYVDNKCAVAKSKEEALSICQMIAEQDSDHNIRWEVEFPQPENYVAFLDTEIRIDTTGRVHSRYYRKPQNKGITLNYRSHHSESTKTAVATNFYRTAREVSSGETELNHSLDIVDKLLLDNEYPQPRYYNKSSRKKKQHTKQNRVSLSLPYTTERDANKIRNYIKSNNIPIRPVFTPGRTLKQQLCRSRPLDSVSCILGNRKNCRICPILTNGTCHQKGVVYKITCLQCENKQIYIGETTRTIHDRVSEHIRAANNPTSHPNNSLGAHYAEHHRGIKANISVDILDTKTNVVDRKLCEVINIYKHKPQLNEKNELESVVKYIVH